MSRVFYTADLHFNHDFVAGTRGYPYAAGHDEVLIERFNKHVTKRDHLWILGDLGMGSLTKVLEKASRLNGVKHLVLGNHDPGHPMHKGSHNKLRRYYDVFESVSLHEQHTIKGTKFMLSHFPYFGDHKDEDRYTEWRLQDTGMNLLCGHLHHLLPEGEQEARVANVGVDHFQHPVTQEEIAYAFRL